jgi:hypothetical protein
MIPQPQTEEAIYLDSFVTDAEECKPLINTVAVESTSTSLKQTRTGGTLSIKGMEKKETASASSVLEEHRSPAPSADRRDQSSTPPGAFELDSNDVGGDVDCVSEDKRIGYPMFGQQRSMSSADPDEASGLLAVRVADSVEKEVRREKDSDQQMESEMVVTSKLLEEAPAKQIERRGRGKSDDKYTNGTIGTTGTLLLPLERCDIFVGSQDSPFALSDTGTDPYFLDSFFSNSRLSFIGSYE